MSKTIKDNDYIQMTLALFCDGIINLHNNLKNKNIVIPINLEKSLDIIKCLCINEGIEFNSSFEGVYDLISKPIKDWGMPFIEEALSSNNDLLDLIIYNKDYLFMGEPYDDGILSGAIKIKNTLCVNEVAEYFRLSKPFYELRANLSQKEYEIFRTFMQGESVFTFDELEEFLFDINSNDAKIIKDNFISEIDNSLIYDGVIHRCVNCGFPMRKNSSNELICHFNKCTEKKYIENINLHFSNELKVKKKTAYYTLSMYTQKYMKIPGIAENKLRNDLHKLKNKFESFEDLNVFPKKDTMDFSLLFKSPKRNVCHLLDVKDFLKSEHLAEIISTEYSKINSKINTLTREIDDNDNLKVETIIIIPDYLIKKDKDYKKTFKEYIDKNSQLKIKIKTISEYIKELRTLLKTLDKEIDEKKSKEIVQLNLLD